MEQGLIDKMPLKGYVAAVSAGIVGDQAMLDLCYEEDSHAQVDLNCVMTDRGELIEIQGTGEGPSLHRSRAAEAGGTVRRGNCGASGHSAQRAERRLRGESVDCPFCGKKMRAGGVPPIRASWSGSPMGERARRAGWRPGPADPEGLVLLPGGRRLLLPRLPGR